MTTIHIPVYTWVARQMPAGKSSPNPSGVADQTNPHLRQRAHWCGPPCILLPIHVYTPRIASSTWFRDFTAHLSRRKGSSGRRPNFKRGKDYIFGMFMRAGNSRYGTGWRSVEGATGTLLHKRHNGSAKVGAEVGSLPWRFAASTEKNKAESWDDVDIEIELF